MFRQPRIAASVFFALLTAALGGLWVRSYLTFDRVVVRSVPNGIMLASHRGRLYTVSHSLLPPRILQGVWPRHP